MFYPPPGRKLYVFNEAAYLRCITSGVPFSIWHRATTRDRQDRVGCRSARRKTDAIVHLLSMGILKNSYLACGPGRHVVRRLAPAHAVAQQSASNNFTAPLASAGRCAAAVPQRLGVGSAPHLHRGAALSRATTARWATSRFTRSICGASCSSGSRPRDDATNQAGPVRHVSK